MTRINIVLRILISGSFIFSAITKWVAPGFFEITLIDQGLTDDRFFAALIARLLIGIEFSLGLLVLLPFYTKKILWIITTMLVVFTAHLAYLWYVGDTENCGCFGEVIKMSPGVSALKNLALIAFCAFAYIKAKPVNKHKYALLAVPIGIILITFLALPVKNYKSFPMEQFRHFKYQGRVDLTSGQYLLAVFSLDCEHCQEVAESLAALQREHENISKTYALFYGEGTNDVSDFEALTDSHFPYVMIDANQFFDFIGSSPPRIYLLEDGNVSDFWDENFIQNIKQQFDIP